MRLFTKKQILTVPNLLSLIRLCLIPVILWLYIHERRYVVTAAVIVLSGLTDVADGFIARRFNMVSDLGKILDPVADKLTQASIIICLLDRYPLTAGLICIFAVKEVTMLWMGQLTIRRKGEVNSAKWHGKACPVLLYLSLTALIIFPNIPYALTQAVIVLNMVMILISLVLYMRFYHGILSE